MVVLRYNIGIRGLKTQNYIAWIGITVVIYAKSHFEVDIIPAVPILCRQVGAYSGMCFACGQTHPLSKR